MIKSILLAGVLAISMTSAAFAGAYEELNAQQQAAVQKGEQVFFTVDASGSAWPKGYIYQAIKATPEEAAAVFADFEIQKNYIPGLKKSQIVNRVNSTTFDIEYTLKASFVTEDYSVRDVISSYDAGQSFKTEWSMIRSDSAKSINGTVRFEKLGTGTLMAYYNFIVPKTPGAGLVKDKAMKQVKETAVALVKQVEAERTNDAALLQKQIEALRAALRGR